MKSTWVCVYLKQTATKLSFVEAVKRRPDLKLIVSSATLDPEKFSKYFFGCPIFIIPGRTYPVEVLYTMTKEPELDYLDASLINVMQIHLSEPPGDILLFLTGQEEIDTACEILFKFMKALGPKVPELIILPIYSALPSEVQSRVFDITPPGARKVVIATNVAETSLRFPASTMSSTLDFFSKMHTTQGWVWILLWSCLFHKHKHGSDPVVQVVHRGHAPFLRKVKFRYNTKYFT